MPIIHLLIFLTTSTSNCIFSPLSAFFALLLSLNVPLDGSVFDRVSCRLGRFTYCVDRLGGSDDVEGELGFKELELPCVNLFLPLPVDPASKDSKNLGALARGVGLLKLDHDPFLLFDTGRVVLELAPEAEEANDDADGMDEAKYGLDAVPISSSSRASSSRRRSGRLGSIGPSVVTPRSLL